MKTLEKKKRIKKKDKAVLNRLLFLNPDIEKLIKKFDLEIIKSTFL